MLELSLPSVRILKAQESMTKTAPEKKAEQWLNEIFGELADLAESCEGTGHERRVRALEAIDNVKITWRMISSARPQPVLGDYSGFRDPSEAVHAYLTNRGKPATEDEIMDAIFEGGYMGGRRDEHRLSVDLAIRNRLTGTGNRNEKLGLKGDIRKLIGLKSWDDALFQQ